MFINKGAIQRLCHLFNCPPPPPQCIFISLPVPTTDLKIDWIWHLLINVLRILKLEISQFAMPPIQVIGPTLPYFNIRKSLFRIFIPLIFIIRM